MANIQVQHENPVQKLKKTLNADSVQQQFKNALKENAALFIASLIDLFANDKYLQQCDPNAVIMEALKAATLKLPINKSLGFAYIVPYKNSKAQNYTPTMIIGYKGYLQMAQRTAQYKYINADCVFEGESIEQDRLTGEIYISGDPSSEKAIGYFAHIETLNGFRKTIFWSKAKVVDHAKRYSQSYASDYSPWKKQFDTMAIKTVLRHLLSRYGIMSVDMAQAVDIDSGDYKEPDADKIERPSISYEATAQAPTEKSKIVDFKQSATPETGKPHLKMPDPVVYEVNYDGDQPIKKSESAVDEFGTPTDSPFEKSKWFHLRAGSPNDGTGYAAYVKTHHEAIAGVSSITFNAMFDKYKKLYGKDFPWAPGGYSADIVPGKGPVDPEIPNGVDDGQAPPPPETEQLPDLPPAPETEVETPLLETEAARTLAGLAGKHKREYLMVVKGRTPETIEQIFEWIEAINQLVVDHAQQPPRSYSDGEKF